MLKLTPFRHFVSDHLFPADAVRAAAESWPPQLFGNIGRLAGSGWVDYDSPLEKKRTLRDWNVIPGPCRDLLAGLLCLGAGSWLGVDPLTPDSMLWGAGLHEMGAGDHLDPHLDSDRHLLTGLERRANAILFLGEWEASWGGELVLGSGDAAVHVIPSPGRLVLWEASDISVHGVPGPIRCPPGVLRKTLAAYYWGLPRCPAKRPRALFLPRPGEHDPARDALRAARSGMMG